MPLADRTWPGNNTLVLKFWIELFKPVKHYLYMAQHIIYCRGKNANIIKVQQKGHKLLISQALLHQVTETRAIIW